MTSDRPNRKKIQYVGAVMNWCAIPEPPPRVGMYGLPMSAPILSISERERPWTAEVRGLLAQGLAQEWNFNQHEALRNLRHAVELEPTCALCWWALARALGPNINRRVMDQDQLNSALEIALEALPASSVSPIASKVAILIQTMQCLRIPAGSNRSVVLAARSLHDAMACSAADQWEHDYEAGLRETERDDDLDTLCADALLTSSAWDYYRQDRAKAVSHTRVPIRPCPNHRATASASCGLS